MDVLSQFGPHLTAMAFLVACSGFFSCSEAALFYLPRRDRHGMRKGNAAQRLAVELLDDPERLLTAILFWNLVTNIVYFAVASMVSLSLEEQGDHAAAGIMAVTSLMTIILFSEMLPKNIAVLQPQIIAPALSVPLAAAVRALDPILPSLRAANRVARRLLLPRLKREPYLELVDLERAIRLSTSDRALLEQEEAVLHNIVSLSEIRVDELMRPRTRYLSFRPPVLRADLKGRLTPSGYLLVTEPHSDEIAGAIPLRYIPDVPAEHLEHFAEPVCHVPWCSTVGQALDLMQRNDLEVAAVVNEHGETIGIVTYDDILDTLFQEQTSRSQRLLLRSSIEPLGDGRWSVTGMTSLRRLGRTLDRELPPVKGVTVAGMLQEMLQRLPQTGDEVAWAGLQFRVIGSMDQGPMTIEVTDKGDPRP
jgi:CBS domain containing-hemolysin-like protein